MSKFVKSKLSENFPNIGDEKAIYEMLAREIHPGLKDLLRRFTGPADVAWWGAVGDGVTDDYQALRRAFNNTDGIRWFTLMGRTYKVVLPGEGDEYYLGKWSNESNIRIDGGNATIDNSSQTYSNTGLFTKIFWVDACHNISIKNVNYTGKPLDNPTSGAPLYQGVGYQGAIVVGVYSGSTNIEVSGNYSHCRYGVHSGDYSDWTLGACRGFRVRLTTSYCGYPVATYLADDINADITSDSSHRSAYIAGCNSGDVSVRFKDQYIASIQVLLTDARDGASSSKGCSNLSVKAFDYGSTSFVANSWCCGFGGENQYSSVKHENIRFVFGVDGSDTVATTIGGFVVANSSGNPFHASASFRNIVVSGTIDRSSQTLNGHGVGEIYAYFENNDGTYPIVDGITFENVVIKKGTAAPTRALWLKVQGLTSNLNIVNCNLKDHELLYVSNTGTSLLRAVNSHFKSIYDPLAAYKGTFIGCAIDTVLPSSLAGSMEFICTPQASSTKKHLVKTFDVALLGTSVSTAAAIPLGATVEAVCGVIVDTITGSSGFQVGTAVDPTLFRDSVDVAIGDSFTDVNSAAAWTAPLLYKASTAIVVTRRAADFTGGTLRLAIHYHLFVAPEV